MPPTVIQTRHTYPMPSTRTDTNTNIRTRCDTTHVPVAICKNGYQHQHKHTYTLQHNTTENTYPLPSARATVAYSGSLSGSTTNPGRTTNDAVSDTASNGFAGGKDLVMGKSGEEKGSEYGDVRTHNTPAHTPQTRPHTAHTHHEGATGTVVFSSNVNSPPLLTSRPLANTEYPPGPH